MSAPRNRRTPQPKPIITPAAKVGKALTAAAKRITGRKIKRTNQTGSWEDEVWYHFMVCGELHYVTSAVANSGSMIELYAAKRDPESDGWMRIDDDNDPAVIALDALAGDSPTGMSELLRRFGQNLFAVGDSYLVGHPHDDQMTMTEPAALPYIDPNAPQDPLEAPGLDLSSLCWKVYAAREIKSENGMHKIAGREYMEDDCVVIRVWRPSPFDCNASDSPVRAVLPLLRELEALTKYVSAVVDSRLAGAGVLFVPDGVSVLGGTSPEDSPDVDPFVVDLMDAMMTPIKDRDAASSLVPLVVTLPDDVAWQPFHMSFASTLDPIARELREEAIRRLALGLDAPPEILLGMGDANHWGAWYLAEEFVKSHILPIINLIIDALVREYLRPVLEAAGVDPLEYTIEADASALTLRPNRSAEAMTLYDKGLITDTAAREATGFGEEDAPDAKPQDEAVTIALQMLTQAPSLAQDPGLPELTNQIRLVLGMPTVTYPEADVAPADTTSAPDAAPQEVPTEVNPGPPTDVAPGEDTPEAA